MDKAPAQLKAENAQKSMKEKKKTEYTPEEKRKLTIRIIAGVIAFIVAVVAFSIAARQLVHKDPGFYNVDTNPDEAAMLYSSGIKFVYHFEGSSNEIRAAQIELKNAYSSALSRIYKLLDAKNTYAGFINIAYVNANRGEEITLDSDLYSVLTSAKELTDEGLFNMFGGALYNEWESIIILEDPADSDPLVNPGMADRMDTIVSAVNDGSNFEFKILDPAQRVISFEVSERYQSLEESNEFNTACIDLGWLREAYELMYVRDMLEKAGYNKGYFTASSGLTLTMSGLDEGDYCMYGIEGTSPIQLAKTAMEPGSACASFRAFDLEDAPRYYTVDVGGETVYRHPHYSENDGKLRDNVLSCMVIDYSGDAVRACCAANAAFALELENGKLSPIPGLDPDMLSAYILKAEQKVIYADEAHIDKLELIGETGTSIKPY